MTRRPLARAVGPLLVLMIGVGCGSASGERAATGAASQPPAPPVTDPVAEVRRFCGLMTQWAQSQRDLQTVDRQREAARYINVLEAHIKMFKDVPVAAPASIRSAMGTVTRISPNPVRVSEANERNEAVKVLDAYVVEKCDVRFSFERVNFASSS